MSSVARRDAGQRECGTPPAVVPTAGVVAPVAVELFGTDHSPQEADRWPPFVAAEFVADDFGVVVVELQTIGADIVGLAAVALEPAEGSGMGLSAWLMPQKGKEQEPPLEWEKIIR